MLAELSKIIIVTKYEKWLKNKSIFLMYLVIKVYIKEVYTYLY